MRRRRRREDRAEYIDGTKWRVGEKETAMATAEIPRVPLPRYIGLFLSLIKVGRTFLRDTQDSRRNVTAGKCTR